MQQLVELGATFSFTGFAQRQNPKAKKLNVL
jgi:hypothetical protein